MKKKKANPPRSEQPARKPGPPARKLTPSEAEKELNAALEQTFPASDPISFESTLVSGSRR